MGGHGHAMGAPRLGLGSTARQRHAVGYRDGKLTGKFGYPHRPAPFGTGMEILYSGMGRVWVPSQKPDSGLGRVWDFSSPPPPPPRLRNY